jgi:hypothetical protein
MLKLAVAVALTAMWQVFFAGPAAAQIRDAVYRGTVVCEKLPFLPSRLRLAMEVTIAGNDARYSRPVMMKENGIPAGTETGTGKIDGGKISLTGGWQGAAHSFSATYSGTFVRRSAKLTGKQIWTHEGKTYERECSGAIKRPLAVFLKKQGT